MACHYYNCDSQGVIDQQRRSAKYIQPLILGIDSALCFLCFYFRSLTVQSVKYRSGDMWYSFSPCISLHLYLCMFHCIFAFVFAVVYCTIVHLSVVYVLRTSEQRKALLLASALRSQTAKPELFFVHISIWFEICICICICICTCICVCISKCLFVEIAPSNH